MDLSKTQARTSFDYGFLIKRIFPYIKPLIFRIIIAFSLAIPLGLLDGVTALALKPYIDVVVNGNEMKVGDFTLTRTMLASFIPIGIVLFALLQGTLKYLNTYLIEWISQTIANSVKKDLFKKLTSLDCKFYDINSSGLVLMRFLGDPDTSAKSFIYSFRTLVTAATSSIGLIAVLLYSSWKLAIVGVLILGCAFLPLALIKKKIKQVSNATAVVGGGINTNINETFHGNKIVAGYGLQNNLIHKFNNQIKENFDLNISLVKRTGWMSPIMYLIASIGIAFVMHFGNTLIVKGELTTGAFASFITSLLLLYKPTKELGNTLTNLQSIFVSMSRVFELFDLMPEIKDKENPKTLEKIEDGIRFNNVHFEYEKDKPVLKGINIEAKKGETVALVGNSGGGKSTVVNLIPRFYDATEGEVLIDNINIKDYSLESLRGNIAEVFQDNFLFSGSIKENILMGKQNATEEELNNVIKLAHLEEVLAEHNLGIDTKLSERGVTLSGGQRQRVAIARAMIKNAPILILDEATSALDNESEAIVQKALENLMQNKTVFVIAHRLSTIKNANKIVVINDGEVAEVGTHEELLSVENGAYKHLYEMQFKSEEE
ncbi:ABC transporter ATP-binding protein [bacterium]|nr:ABC transporter ATP-binding protein [bacterium]